MPLGSDFRDVPAPPVPAARVVFSPEDRAEIARRVDAAVASGSLTLGANTREFEQALADSQPAQYAIAVSSGTAALEIVLRSLDVAGREVIVPANTFAATAFAVLAAGGRPVFADVDTASFALTVDSVAEALSPDTAAVVVVHIGGLITPQITALQSLCASRDVPLVEDAAHAHGCSFAGVAAGSFGVAGTLSFYPTKVITSGEGGAILTANPHLRDEALAYRDQGKAGFSSNLHTHRGYAWRMSELHAAVGLIHLRRLAEFVERRTRIAARYTAGLRGIAGLAPVLPAPGARSNFYKYPVLLDDAIDRSALKQRLRDEFGVSLSGDVYATPLHRQPVFASLCPNPLPVAEHVCAHHACLPLHSDMTDDEADRVLEAVDTVVSGL
jgi:dTDP-4-amino-4,6-dideoxygalactose transaminase